MEQETSFETIGKRSAWIQSEFIKVAQVGMENIVLEAFRNFNLYLDPQTDYSHQSSLYKFHNYSIVDEQPNGVTILDYNKVEKYAERHSIAFKYSRDLNHCHLRLSGLLEEEEFKSLELAQNSMVNILSAHRDEYEEFITNHDVTKAYVESAKYRKQMIQNTHSRILPDSSEETELLELEFVISGNFIELLQYEYNLFPETFVQLVSLIQASVLHFNKKTMSVEQVMQFLLSSPYPDKSPKKSYLDRIFATVPGFGAIGGLEISGVIPNLFDIDKNDNLVLRENATRFMRDISDYKIGRCPFAQVDIEDGKTTLITAFGHEFQRIYKQAKMRLYKK